MVQDALNNISKIVDSIMVEFDQATYEAFLRSDWSPRPPDTRSAPMPLSTNVPLQPSSIHVQAHDGAPNFYVNNVFYGIFVFFRWAAVYVLLLLWLRLGAGVGVYAP